MKRKMKRYAEGDLVDDENPEAQEVDRKSYATGVRMSEDYTKTPKKTAAKSSTSRSMQVTAPEADYGREGRHPKVEDAEDTRGTMERKGRMGFRRDAPSAEQKAANADRLATVASLAIPAAGVARGAMAAHKAANAARLSKALRGEYTMHMTPAQRAALGMKKGGSVKRYAKGGSVSSASKRADGIAQRGKTKGRML